MIHVHTYLHNYGYLLCWALSFLQVVVPGAKSNQRFASTKTDRQSSVPQQTAAVDGTQRPVPTKKDQQSFETTTGGTPYAVFKGNRISLDEMKNKKVCTNLILMIQYHEYAELGVITFQK